MIITKSKPGAPKVFPKKTPALFTLTRVTVFERFGNQKVIDLPRKSVKPSP